MSFTILRKDTAYGIPTMLTVKIEFYFKELFTPHKMNTDECLFKSHHHADIHHKRPPTNMSLTLSSHVLTELTDDS